MSRPDLSAAITLHREGILCVPSLRSYLQCCSHAREHGFTVEFIATLDRTDEATLKFFRPFARHFDLVEQLDFGDLSKCRNTAAQKATGQYVAYFDGDDLWGDSWLTRAMKHAAATDSASVFHPHVLYYFVNGDFAVHSQTAVPSALAASHLMIHEDSTSPGFDPDCLWFDNVWSANSLALKELYLTHPFPQFRRADGFGIEDWAWNHRIMRSGIAHRVVPDTVHMVRVKETGSLQRRNMMEDLLPDLHASARGPR
jgi:hypothetical protein